MNSSSQTLSKANTWLVVTVLIVSTLFHSELGGEGTPYNAANVGLLSLFILLNNQFDRGLTQLAVVAAAFLGLSVVGNASQLPLGAYRSAGATAVGIFLFAIRPVPFDHALLRRLVILFLTGCLVASVVYSAQRTGLTFNSGNANFNVNQNAAALFFVSCALLALAIVRASLGWIFALSFTMLTLTTGSRAGAVCTSLMFILYVLFAGAAVGEQMLTQALRRASLLLRVVAGLAVLFLVARWLVPEAIDLLVLRFEIATSRSDQWREGWAGIDSVRGLLLGYGPTMLGLRSDINPHNSYIDAVGSSGAFFLVSMLWLVLAWTLRQIRDQTWDIVWVMSPVLIYGLVETFLFNGLNSLWLVTILVGLAVHSRRRRLGCGLPPALPAHLAQVEPVTRRLVTARRSR